jgi:uncharacterized OB-fold protein
MSVVPAGLIKLQAPDRDSGEYWESVDAKQFMVQRCTACGRYRWPARRFCNACASDEYSLVEASRGRVYSWIIVHHAALPELKAHVPYNVCMIQLDLQEDLLVIGGLVGADNQSIVPGLEVEVCFEQARDSRWLPYWRPVGSG